MTNLGKLQTLENQDRKFGAPAKYHCVQIVNEDGEYETLMLTDSDLKRFRARAAKNPEDVIPPPVPEPLPEEPEPSLALEADTEPAADPEAPTDVPEGLPEWKSGWTHDLRRWWESLRK